MQSRALEIEASARAMEHQEGNNVDREPPDGDEEHRSAENGRGMGEAHRRFDDDPGREREHDDAVEESGEDFGAMPAIGTRVVGGPPRQAYGDPGERQRARVGEHVAGIGNEGERARKNAAERLDDHEAAGEPERHEHAPLIASAVRMRMAMRMTVMVMAVLMMVMIVGGAHSCSSFTCATMSAMTCATCASWIR